VARRIQVLWLGFKDRQFGLQCEAINVAAIVHLKADHGMVKSKHHHPVSASKPTRENLGNIK
jgi:hypothetical protein